MGTNVFIKIPISFLLRSPVLYPLFPGPFEAHYRETQAATGFYSIEIQPEQLADDSRVNILKRFYQFAENRNPLIDNFPLAEETEDLRFFCE